MDQPAGVTCGGMSRRISPPSSCGACLNYERSELGALYGQTYSKSMDQPSKVDNPARGQPNREND